MSLVRDHWKQKGYYFVGDGRCKYCGELIEWWSTTNEEKDTKIPLDRGVLTNHMVTCRSRPKPEREPSPQTELPGVRRAPVIKFPGGS